MYDPWSSLLYDAATVAQRLIGCELVRECEGQYVRVKIVETEAYDQTDAASHSYNGRTPRTDIMFGSAGNLYVYFTYGMHYCCNIVVGTKGYGAAVLIRAVEPLAGETHMKSHRDKPGVELCNGPAKLCQALAIDTSLNGHDLTQRPVQLVLHDAIDSRHITRTTRIGITKATDTMWRFYLTGNRYVSRL